MLPYGVNAKPLLEPMFEPMLMCHYSESKTKIRLNISSCAGGQRGNGSHGFNCHICYITSSVTNLGRRPGACGALYLFSDRLCALSDLFHRRRTAFLFDSLWVFCHIDSIWAHRRYQRGKKYKETIAVVHIFRPQNYVKNYTITIIYSSIAYK